MEVDNSTQLTRIKAGDTGRDASGRYLPGHSLPGPGRPPRQREVDYLRVTTERVPVSEWAQVVDQALDDAKGGDAAARTFLAAYLLGPPQNLIPTRFVQAVVRACASAFHEANRYDGAEQRAQVFAARMAEMAEDATG